MMSHIDKQESRRLHDDWWGQCRTCRFWNGADVPSHTRWADAPCTNPRSILHGQETGHEGYCPQWDSFDLETALEVLEESYRVRAPYRCTVDTVSSTERNRR